jgi:anti-sigma factor RsiW
MKVTRDVIYDLLPGYFAGEISADTRALVDEFLRDDPEFARMMERFRAVFSERVTNERAPGAAARDKEAFERARSFLQKRSELRGYVVAFALATLSVLMLPLISGRPMRVALWAIAGAFAATSVIAAVQLHFLNGKAIEPASGSQHPAA